VLVTGRCKRGCRVERWGGGDGGPFCLLDRFGGAGCRFCASSSRIWGERLLVMVVCLRVVADCGLRAAGGAGKGRI
jgi:hypothetical protein